MEKNAKKRRSQRSNSNFSNANIVINQEKTRDCRISTVTD